jgi:PncC family amidohydrolase
MYDLKAITGIKNYMMKHNQTLSVAESVTSGHLQAALSLADNASLFFQGGITVYNLGQKSRHLNINPIHAMSCNSVSATIAEEMAVNALSLFSSDWSLAITGYAAPVPELKIENLFAFYAIAFRNKVVEIQKIRSGDDGIFQVQLNFTDTVLKRLNRHLREKKK